MLNFTQENPGLSVLALMVRLDYGCRKGGVHASIIVVSSAEVKSDLRQSGTIILARSRHSGLLCLIGASPLYSQKLPSLLFYTIRLANLYITIVPATTKFPVVQALDLP